MNIELQREGYIDLINICASSSRKEELIAFANNLNDFNGDENYLTTLNFVMSFLDKNGFHLIMALDWKQEIQDLHWRISSSLKDNFNKELELPDSKSYGENKSVSDKNVFKDYDQALRKGNFQLSFIDTNSDEYVIVLHETKDEEKLSNAIKKIGYESLKADAPKISG